MRTNCMAMMLLFLSGLLSAQDVSESTGESEKESTSFETLQLKADLLIGNLKSNQMLQHLEGSVKLVFVAKDPAENMTIYANTIDFIYDEADADDAANEETSADDSSPSKMELNGDITVEAQGMRILSQKAFIDLETMDADFIGYTEIFQEGDKEPIQANRVVINFETDEVLMKEVFIPTYNLNKKNEVQESTTSEAEESAPEK